MTADAAELLALDRIAIRDGERLVFRGTRWTWRRGEQWAVLGPNGSGKSLLALALCGRAPVMRGEFRLGFGADAAPENDFALLSPHVQREMVLRESSFYQSRWHGSLGEGGRTVAQFLSQAGVEEINPFEVGARRGETSGFRQRRRRWVRWLGMEPLLRRKLIHLSNGEQRKILLVHTLLRAPRLLVLDDPFGGLDVATRRRLREVIARLMRGGLPTLVITSRPDEIPPETTHVLLVKNRRVVAQGAKAAMLRHPLARQLAAGQAGRPSCDGTNIAPENQRLMDRNVRSTPPGPPLIELNHVTIRRGSRRILDDVTWTARRGEHWALLGPNGSGKTTLLSLIQGDNPQAYALDLRLFGARPHSTQTLWHTRQKIGWLSPELHQHYPVAWSCLDVVCSGFFNSIGLHQHCTPRQRAAARHWLRDFGLAGNADKALGELSLGDQRMLLLARAAVKKPRLLILDEPCQGLDTAHRRAVLDTVDRVVAQTGATLIFVTHHAGEMPRCVGRVLRLKAGRASLGKRSRCRFRRRA
jgi:molybdate transport system ATP-binding protein